MKYHGPYEIVATRNVTTMGVRMVGTTAEPQFVHWSLLKRFCGSEVELPAELVEQAQQGAGQLTVEHLRDIRADADGNVELLVSWEGFLATYDSWEPAVDLYDDIGARVTKFVKARMKDNDAMNALHKKLTRRKRGVKRK